VKRLAGLVGLRVDEFEPERSSNIFLECSQCAELNEERG
jgi:hypothetical protein